MSEDNFKFPPDMRKANVWAHSHGYMVEDVEEIQRDAVMAARREIQRFAELDDMSFVSL